MPLELVHLGAWHRLPVELMSDIFVKLLDEQLLESPESNTGYAVPTIISLVSSEWRALALNTPRLWSKIKIINKRGSHTLPIWLERSKHSPLALKFRFALIYNISLHHALKAIQDHIHHIVDLDITTNTFSQYNTVIMALNRPAPILHTLRLRGMGPWADIQERIPVDLAQGIMGGGGCPNLLSLDILSAYSWPTNLVENLTKLNFSALGSGSDGSHVLHHMECAPNVTDLTLEISNQNYAPGGVALKSITLRAITRLSIVGHFDEILALLGCLHLPNLRSLTLQSYERDEDEGSATWILSGNMAAFPLLERLKFNTDMLDYNPVIIRHLPAMLRRCDNLKELLLGHTHEVLSVLVRHLDTPEGKERPLCPHLAHISVDIPSSSFWFKRRPKDHILDFLSSRTNTEGRPMAQLQTLSLRGKFRERDPIEQAASYRPLVAKSVYYDDIEI